MVFEILVSIKVYKKLHPGIRFYGRLSGVVLIGTVLMCHSFSILVAVFYRSAYHTKEPAHPVGEQKSVAGAKFAVSVGAV